MGGKRVIGSEFPAPKIRLPSFYLLLVFFSLTAGIVAAAFLYYRNYEKHYQAKAGGRNRVAYAVQDGRGSRAT